MKKIILISALSLVMFYSSAFAHPPSDITITFDAGTKVLKAVITHQVNDPVKHFIEKVDVGLNGKEIIEHRISRQDNNINQTVFYYIPDAKPGDTFSVEAYCSISGKLEKAIK